MKSAKYPKSERNQIKSRILWGISIHPDGHKEWNYKNAGEITYKAFPGLLPGGVTLKDSLATTKKKLTKLWGKLESYRGFYYHDKKRDLGYVASFAHENKGKVKKGMLETFYVGIKVAYD